MTFRNLGRILNQKELQEAHLRSAFDTYMGCPTPKYWERVVRAQEVYKMILADEQAAVREAHRMANARTGGSE